MKKSGCRQEVGVVGRVRRLCGAVAGVAVLGAGWAMSAAAVNAAGAPAGPDIAGPAAGQAGGQTEAFATTVAYVSQFYPLWFTYYQSLHASHNRLVGPSRVTPIYQTVVAINVDTLYASTFFELAAQPVVLTVPSTTANYSILTVDAYGDIFDAGIAANTAGTYALTGPGFSGSLPSGVTQISMPVDFGVLIFRADKFSSSGVDETAAAQEFRASLKMQELCDYTGSPCPGGAAHSSNDGSTLILPVAAFAIPYKTIADTLVATDPIAFLKQLQTAVASSNTPPMTPAVAALAKLFDRQFGSGGAKQWDFAAGAQAAHALILQSYLTHTGSTNWINFENIGDWGDQIVQRSAITEFIQYGNGHSTAAYYQAFKDGSGQALDGSHGNTYVLTFPAGQLPQAKRFWSVTAYTPNAIELVANSAQKYEVASYDSGLVTSPDGSLSIYMAPTLPAGVPAANWLPIPQRAFNVMLRVYGPEGSVAAGTYVPPAVAKNP